MQETKELIQLEPGMKVIHNGDQVYTVDPALANEFKAGDQLVFVRGFDKPVIIPKFAIEYVNKAIENAKQGFYKLAAVKDEQIHIFYDQFRSNLLDHTIWTQIQEVNESDVEKAKAKGRSVTRLIANETCRQGMIEGLSNLKEQPVSRVSTINKIDHGGWSVDLIKSPLGVVGFVFEGRPNVIADATGVIKSGNAVVFRVGSDARQTANAIVEYALYPALDAAKISRQVIQMINRSERSTAWALFSNTQLNLAVARGSGQAVRLLGGIAQQYGIPVSLHGTGGAWMMVSETTDPNRLKEAILGSLDRKVCNTLNTLCITKSRVRDCLPVSIEGLQEAGEALGQRFKVHVETGSKHYFKGDDFTKKIQVERKEGSQKEYQYEEIKREALGKEWEWEQTPEVTIVVVESVEEAIQLYNTYSPQFVAT